MTIAFKNARVYSYNPRSKTYSRFGGLIVDNGTIVSFEPENAGAGVRAIDLGGATILPAFSDCHVHLTDTGYFLGARNLSGVRSYDEFARAVSALPRERHVLAGQYDESAWRDKGVADAAPLERAFPDAYAMAVRIDGHSCVINRKTFEWLNLSSGTSGIEQDAEGRPTGKLFLEANWRAQSAFMAALPLAIRREAERRAVELALSRGCLHLHAQLVGFARDEYAAEVAAFAALPKAKFYPKICEPDARLAKELGLPSIGGDVFLDGSIGSCTAAVSEPFVSAAEAMSGADRFGTLRYSDDEVYNYFLTAHELGISAGVHAIGDRAIEQCISTWERVLTAPPRSEIATAWRGGPERRHFIEHFEIARDDQLERCARLGLYLSMQPQFDLLWGGAGAMYESRLGTNRMRTMNALGRIERAGGVLCGGDDSPVCELSPLLGMHAAVNHHEPSERLTAQQALTMYTYNAARLAHCEERTGVLAEGYAADLTVLDRDPTEDGDFKNSTVLATYRDGEKVYEAI